MPYKECEKCGKRHKQFDDLSQFVGGRVTIDGKVYRIIYHTASGMLMLKSVYDKSIFLSVTPCQIASELSKLSVESVRSSYAATCQASV